MRTKIGNKPAADSRSLLVVTIILALTIAIPYALSDAYAANNGNGNSNQDEEKKTVICHIPPGNPNNPQTLDVADSSVPAHLAHGDYLGECIISQEDNEQSNSESNEQSNPENNEQGNENVEQNSEESNEAQAENEPILIRGGGGLSFDVTPPTVNAIGISSIQSGTVTQEFGGRLQGYSNEIPTQIMHTGEEQRLQINVYDNNGILAIKRVVVNMHFDYIEIQKGDTYFVYIEESGEFTVSDPLGIFGDVEVHRTFSDAEMILTFVFTPQKPLSATDIVINAEDEYRNNINTIIVGAFEIQGEPLISIEEATTSSEIPYYNNSAWNQVVIDSDGTMMTYDSFGNLEKKDAPVNDEYVQYGNYIGRSERHDDGFHDKVSAEEVRAQEVVDSMITYESLAVPDKVFKTDKTFNYPSNVGKSDREDVKQMSDLKHKEHLKAMDVVKNIT